MRIRKLAYNSISSFVLQITTIVCGFILPRLIISNFGSETNGLVNSIAQLLQIISFVELGMGAVVQSALYKPLAQGNEDEISKIIASATRFFRRIAYILSGYVFLLVVLFPFITKEDLDPVSTAFLIIAMSISSFAQYYFGIVDSLLLNADQKGYFQYNAQSITLILNTIVSVLLIKSGASIQIVKLSTAIIFILRPIAMRIYINKNYNVDRNIEYDVEPIKQKWNGIAQHIASVVLVRTDVVVLTIFQSLSDVSIYSVYQLIATGVQQLFMSMTSGAQAAMGELWAKQEKEKLFSFFSWFQWLVHNGTVFVFGCAGMLIIPFVSIYTKGVTDADYFQPMLAIILIASNAVYSLRLPNSIMILAGGHYKQTQNYYFVAAILNIVVAIVTVKIWGLNGVAFGSLVAMLFHTIWMTIYNSKNLVKWPLKNVLKQIVVDILAVFLGIIATMSYKMASLSYFSWCVLALKTAATWALILLLINCLFYREKVNGIINATKRLIEKRKR